MKRYEFSKNEHGIQSAGFNWIRRNRKHSPNEQVRIAMKLCHAIPNGVSTEESQKAKLEGLTAGIPDIHLPWPKLEAIEKHSFEQLGEPIIKIREEDSFLQFIPGLYIEMKYGGNTLYPDQVKIKDLLLRVGYRYRICRSTKEMIKAIMDYLPFHEQDYIQAEYL